MEKFGLKFQAVMDKHIVEIEQIILMIFQNVNSNRILNMCSKRLEMLFHFLSKIKNLINSNRNRIQS